MTFLSHQNIVLMPGLDGTGKSFEPLLPSIAEDARVTIVRYPTDRLLSFDETVNCAAAQIPEGTSPVFIAESFSGPVAIRLIASGLVRAKALVLCATFARSPHPLMWSMVRFLRMPLLIRPEMPRPFFKFIIGDDQRIEALLPLWKKVHAEVPASVMDFRLSIINSIDVLPDLPKLTLPCLFLQAQKDRVIPEGCLKEIACRIPQLQVEKIQAPHFILQAEPLACLAAIDNFLTQIQ